MRFVGWLGIAVMFLFALPWPLVLLGLPLEYAWPLALAGSAVVLFVRPGGTAEKFIIALFVYGMMFTLWCVAGAIAVILLGLVVDGIRPPVSHWLIAAVGACGVARELLKTKPPKVEEKP